MTELPLSIVNALATLLPGDLLIAHCGKEGWAKLEVSVLSHHAYFQRCPHGLWEEAVAKLPEDFIGSLTFTHDARRDDWMYQIRAYLPVEKTRTVPLGVEREEPGPYEDVRRLTRLV